MKILFELNHPKHYLQYKQLADKLDGEITSYFIAKDKDVLLQLLEQDNRDYFRISVNSKNVYSKIFYFGKYLKNYLTYIDKIQPDVIVSKASPYAALAGKYRRIPTIITPDSEVVMLTNKFVAPLSNLVITQETFGLDYGKKHRRVRGLFEDQYLHPKYFSPDKEKLMSYGINPGEKYAILRFVGWSANHDIGRNGASINDKLYLVNELRRHCRVFISSENYLPDYLEEYRLPTPPHAIHQALHFASLYLGDSQTMATEAALLGTPSIRVNSFVGENDMSNFKILEKEYQMLFNHTNINDALLRALDILKNRELKNEWLEKRNTYYRKENDINEEIVEIIYEVLRNKRIN